MPMPSCSNGDEKESSSHKLPLSMNAGGSFGKASICSGFSVRSGSSNGDRDQQIEKYLKTHSLDYSANDANSIRLAINKTSELDSSAGPLKKISEKPNNQTPSKLVNNAAAPLSPSLIKCNILKGKCDEFSGNIKGNVTLNGLLFIHSILLARSEEDSVPTKLTNQLLQQYPGSEQPPSLESATFVSVVS